MKNPEQKSNMFFSVGPQKNTPRKDYRIDAHDCTYMKQNVRAFEGACIVVAEPDDFFCSFGKSQRYESAVMVDPTWARLFAASKSAQMKTGDFHHQFLEGVYPTGDKRTVNGVEVTVLRFSLGS